mmetsp:Transcript_31245/g.53956  ORF Transcript_31245/g.53956 Transcript_31245/m.53956 type:complete len:81 (-) Transcript_31245:190-432(-)
MGEFPGIFLSAAGLPRFNAGHQVLLDVGKPLVPCCLAATVKCWSRSSEDEPGFYKIQIQDNGLVSIPEEILHKRERTSQS